MADTPVVSVVVPAYNVAAYIEPAVESVLAQTLSNFELIVVDDGSTDDTWQRLARFRDDPRVRIISEPNRGLPGAIARGIELTSAPLVAFLDGDDLWAPPKLERHADFFALHPEVDLTFSWSRMVDEDGVATGRASPAWRGSVSFAQLLIENVVGNGSAPVIRRAALLAAGGIDTSFLCCHDWEFLLRVALLRPDNVQAVPECLTYYRSRPGQLTRNVDLMERHYERLMERARTLAPSETSRVETLSRSNMRRFLAFSSYQDGAYPVALRMLRRSLVTAPGCFLSDGRNWQMTAAALAGLALPSRWHGVLIRAALSARGA
jgi:glycosyltransferase involved in cell wall biosynthesis